MQIETFTYDAIDGWSCGPFPALDSVRTLVLVFGDSVFFDAPAPLAELRAAYPQAKHLGCSTAGEIAGSHVLDVALSVAVVRFAHTDLAEAHVEIPAGGDADAFALGLDLADQLVGPGLRGVLVMSDGVGVNGSRLVEGLNAGLPTDVMLSGGLAGDDDRFGRTWILGPEGVELGRIVAIGLYGDRVTISHGSRGGWEPFGPERVITRAVGNVVYELDGKPALALYKNYLGDRAAELPALGLRFPIGIRTRDSAGEEQFLVRTLLGIDEESQSLRFAGDVPVGSRVQLMRSDAERLVSGATEAAVVTCAGDGAAGPVLAIAVSCAGRRWVLGERVEDETEAVLDEMPAGTRLIGFYSYGEIASFGAGRPVLHNQTMTLTAIAEH